MKITIDLESPHGAKLDLTYDRGIKEYTYRVYKNDTDLLVFTVPSAEIVVAFSALAKLADHQDESDRRVNDHTSPWDAR